MPRYYDAELDPQGENNSCSILHNVTREDQDERRRIQWRCAPNRLPEILPPLLLL